MSFKRHRKIILTGLTALVSICGCSRQEEETASEFRTLPAVIGNVQTYVTFIGNVTGGQTSSLTWGTNGVIESGNVSLGILEREG